MWVRTQLKIGWADLLVGALACLVPGDRTRLAASVERYFDPQGPAAAKDGDTIVAFSVRSGFDTLIQALDLEAGDEVLFSALNVKGMITVARKAGLVPVPLDLDVDHMAPSPAQLERVITPRTRMLVLAHLFGSRIDVDALFEVAHRHGLFVVEDCAQAFNGRAYPGHDRADAVMFSFGPIKTATALGGGLIRVKDAGLRARMRDLQSGYPVQRNRAQLKRVLQFGALKLVTARPLLALIYRYYEARGRSYEDELADRARDVAPLGKVKQRRYQPSAGMLALLARRLDRFDAGTIERRAAAGRRLAAAIGDAVVLPAQANPHHDYWVFPILADRPDVFIDRLRRAGFDAADLPRSQAVAAPPGAPQLEPRIAAQALADLLVVPCYPAIPAAELDRQARLIRAVAAEVGSARTQAYARLGADPVAGVRPATGLAAQAAS